MDSTMKYLEECFETAKRDKYEYIGIKIQMEGFPEPEVIINPNSNFDAKLEYYKKAYNDDLTLKAFKGIKIIGCMFGEDYNDIENYLIYDDYSKIGI